MLLVNQCPNCLNRMSDQFCQFYNLFAELDVAPADARHVQKILNQPAEVTDLPLDHRQLMAGPVSAASCLLQEIEGRLNRSQRIAKLVREDSQKLLLAAVGVAKLLFSQLSLSEVQA